MNLDNMPWSTEKITRPSIGNVISDITLNDAIGTYAADVTISAGPLVFKLKGNYRTEVEAALGVSKFINAIAEMLK